MIGMRVVGMIVVCLASVAMLAPGAQARAKPPLFGFNEDLDAFAKHAHAAGSLGQTLARVPANWKHTERLPGAYDWEEIDAAAERLHATGARLLFVISDTPVWARGFGCSSGTEVCPVGEGYEDEYVAFAEALAARYPNARIQSWNEPNIELFGDISATRAAELTNDVAAALPGRIVGPAPSPGDDDWLSYLSQLYDEIDPRVPLAANVYPRSAVRARGLKSDWRHIRRIARRDHRKVWVTEIGFAASDYGQRGQARAASWAYRYLARHGAKTVIFHRLIDPKVQHSWATTLGMMRADGSRRPVFRALAKTVRREGRRIAGR